MPHPQALCHRPRRAVAAAALSAAVLAACASVARLCAAAPAANDKSIAADKPVAGTGPAAAFPRVPPTEPAAAAGTFRAVGGFRMDLVAAEPLVTDPVALAYDEDGRAFVAEMNDYPYTDAATHQPWKENTTDAPIGRIRLLTDTDGDGTFDKSTVFAEGLSWPTGVACWRGGVFVAATPDVWYLKDTDGDGKADVRQKVFTGFRKYNVQAVMNNLVWGLDNQLYGAGGTNGGSVTSGDAVASGVNGGSMPASSPATKPVTMARNDFRFDPTTGRFEAIAGGARFGNAFDDWGNRFVCNIRNPAQHVVIDGRYLARNPHLPVASAVQDVAEAGDALAVHRISPPELWRDVRARRLATEQNSSQPRSELVAAGVVTSASGVTVYRGDAYPPGFRGQLFVGEVANNLVHRQAVRPAGATFASTRIDDGVEFVASTDVWFRPVNFANAPDGTLHVLDMYREVIEHPWSIPDDIRAKLDLRSGADRGRIFRLAPPGFAVPKPPRLGQATTAELVAALSRPAAWWRETAQRLIVERQDRAAVPLLRAVLEKGDEPLGRLHALWTLEGLSAVAEGDLLRGLADASPGVRENAVRVAERHLSPAGDALSPGREPSPATRPAGGPKLLDRLLVMADDADPRVRFQVALTLGDAAAADPRVSAALAAVAKRDAADPWALTAVLSSAAGRAGDLLAALGGDDAFANSAPGREALRRLAAAAGARNDPAEVGRALTALPSAPGARSAVAVGLGEGLRRQRRTLRQAAPDAESAAGRAVAGVLADARRTAADPSAPADDREAATRLVGFDDFEQAAKVLPDLLDPRQPPGVQRAALAALSGTGRADVGAMLLARWPKLSPTLRPDAVQAMLGYRNRLPALLTALEAGRVPPHDVPAARRAALLNDKDPAVAARAAKLFGGAGDGGGAGGVADRRAVVARYAAAVPGLTGDPAAGLKVYEAQCATCHKSGDRGHDLGPNLATVRGWTAEQILVNVLDPGREVAPAFAEYLVELTDGETLAGVIAEETPTALTVRWAGGGQRTVARQSVAKLSASRASPMPEGLEAGIDPQAMADLIGYLRRGP